MTSIIEKAAKQVKDGNNVNVNTILMRSCIKAEKCLHEVNMYINTYLRDAEYEDEVDNLRRTIDGVETECNVEDQGKLLFHGKMMFKLSKDEEYVNNSYLMLFTKTLLVFALKPKKERQLSLSQKLFSKPSKSPEICCTPFLSSPDHPDETYVYIRSISASKEMCMVEEGIVNKNKKKLTIQTWKNFKTIEKESFSILINRGKELQEVKNMFSEWISLATVSPVGKHINHKFTSIEKPNIDIASVVSPPICAECGIYIFGFIYMGYQCKDCGGNKYHETCFLTGKLDESISKYSYDDIDYIIEYYINFIQTCF